MQPDFPAHVGPNAIEHLLAFCQRRGFRRFNLVSDSNTGPILGETIQARLEAQGWEVLPVQLPGENLAADEAAIFQVLLQAGPEPRVYLSVGSGTLTDIVRFASHRTRAGFISLPTAPSVDAYTSLNAPLVIQGLKRTIRCHAPLAVFADLQTLQSAPHPMIAAGFGDILGKYTALADWKLGSLLWGEAFDPEVAQANVAALGRCVTQVDGLGRGEAASVQTLMEALFTSGWSMVVTGNSNPASGAEHHLSHYWEMMAFWQGQPPLLHGIKVGLGTVLISLLYTQIAKMERKEAQERLGDYRLPERGIEMARIERYYGHAAREVLEDQAPFLDLTENKLNGLKLAILEQWDAIREIASGVPEPAALQDLLRRAGAPVTPGQAGLTENEVSAAMEAGHYIRARFTVRRLAAMLGLH